MTTPTFDDDDGVDDNDDDDDDDDHDDDHDDHAGLDDGRVPLVAGR